MISCTWLSVNVVLFILYKYNLHVMFGIAFYSSLAEAFWPVPYFRIAIHMNTI